MDINICPGIGLIKTDNFTANIHMFMICNHNIFSFVKSTSIIYVVQIT